MKNRIFMYLFVFALLLVLFQYMNAKSAFESYEAKIVQLRDKAEDCEKRIIELEDENFELMHFNMETNDDALSYFENQGLDATKLMDIIKDEIFSLNVYTGDDHPLVPYASMTDNKIMINTIKLVNHKWILADFSDGKYWGEIFMTYEVNEKSELKFKVVEHFLYPPTTY
ncbi:MAG: hydrolase [Bacteroidetes bacterium MedPE-SWsnd-G2]|nr:MAG: hydrolase [Bacteroidetes bacterium MedPE-SWsnd-G2]